MKRNTIILITIVAALALWSVAVYNGLINREEAVKQAWSQVENDYQRRADLIPNLVATVKGYAAHESSTLQNVIDARAKATQVQVDPTNLTSESILAYQQAQGEIGAALSRLLMIQENYPDLKANQNFLELQAQLEGTENRITVARKRFNEAAQQYNVSLRRFPQNLVAKMFGFQPQAYFETEAGNETAPTVSF